MNETERIILLALSNIQKNQIELTKAIGTRIGKKSFDINLKVNSEEIDKALAPQSQEMGYEKDIKESCGICNSKRHDTDEHTDELMEVEEKIKEFDERCSHSYPNKNEEERCGICWSKRHETDEHSDELMRIEEKIKELDKHSQKCPNQNEVKKDE